MGALRSAAAKHTPLIPTLGAGPAERGKKIREFRDYPTKNFYLKIQTLPKMEHTEQSTYPHLQNPSKANHRKTAEQSAAWDSITQPTGHMLGSTSCVAGIFRKEAVVP